jgi:hypothetical protein
MNQKIQQQKNQIITAYIDQDPLLRNLRANLIDWNAQNRAGIGLNASGEIIYKIGRLLAAKGQPK